MSKVIIPRVRKNPRLDLSSGLVVLTRPFAIHLLHPRCADRNELIWRVIQGYDFSDDMVKLYFRMSRTQYYDYVFNVLDKVKVTT